MGGPARVLYLHSSSGHYGADRQLQLLATGIDHARFQPLVVLPGPGVLAPCATPASRCSTTR